MIRYRIYTEHKNYEELVKLVQSRLTSATIFPGLTGIWEGTSESALVIEYIGGATEKDVKQVYGLARAIKEYNSQEEVLVTKELVETRII